MSRYRCRICPLHHCRPPAVADIELGDFFVVLVLGDLAALQRVGIFLDLHLVGGLERAQFSIREAHPGRNRQVKINGVRLKT